MQELARGVYFETAYPGVTLGAIVMAHGSLLVDAPPRPEDGRAWRIAIHALGGGVDSLLVNLDAHYDRTLGVRAMDATVVAHEKTAEDYRSRSTTFKAQPGNTGAEWEQIGGLGSVRWAPPDVCFSNCMSLHWGEVTVQLEVHAGPTPGSIWVVVPEARTVFIGDLVTPNQPPFLANADLAAWLESLDTLNSPLYRDYRIIGGRCGLIPAGAIDHQSLWLEKARAHLERLQSQAAPIEELETIIPDLMQSLEFPAERREAYLQRLRWGLTQAYTRPAQVDPVASGEVEE